MKTLFAFALTMAVGAPRVSCGQETTLSGVARPDYADRVASALGARVQLVAKKIGDRVRKGETLVVLAADDLELAARAAAARVESARVTVKSTKVAQTRIQKLYMSQAASRADVDKATAAHEAARAALKAAVLELKRARAKIDLATIRSPRDGTIAEITVQKGQQVSAAQPVAVVVSPTTGVVEVKLTGKRPPGLANGAEVSVTYSALGKKVFVARVLDLVRDMLTIRVAKPDAAIKAGMVAEVRFRAR